MLNRYLSTYHQIAKASGGQLLSTEWRGARAKYDFAFADGRAFVMTGDSLKQNGWPKNADLHLKRYGCNREEYHLENLRSIAAAAGGSLLSTRWTNSAAKYHFAFTDGRRFWMKANTLRHFGWPKDADLYLRKYSLEKDQLRLDELRRIASANGGALLSTEWCGNTAKYRFSFSDGREFSMSAVSVKFKGWPKDPDLHFKMSSVNNKDYLHLEFLRKFAESRGGKLISTEWHGNHAIYEFEDKSGRQFKQAGDSIKYGYWAPYLGLVSEPVCRQVMEHLLGVKFISTWKVVKIKGYKALQLDGYAEAVSLNTGVHRMAFEYQGFWSHRGKEAVIKRDRAKARFCVENDIILVVIDPFRKDNPWDSEYVQLHVKKAIVKAFHSAHKAIPILNDSEFKIDMAAIHSAATRYEEFKGLVEAAGGRLLSEEYLGSMSDHRVAFHDGREFLISPIQIATRGWPANPDRYFRLSAKNLNRSELHLGDLRKIATDNGGRLLSTEWVGAMEKYHFAFADGREFWIKANTLKTSGWPTSAYRYFRQSRTNGKDELHLQVMKSIAEGAGGALLSSTWRGIFAKYHFAFADGREFWMQANALKNSGWPKCADQYFMRALASKGKIQLQYYRAIAEANGGRLLSTEWGGIEARYHFAFANGREFWMRAHNLRGNGWPKNSDQYFRQSKTSVNRDQLNLQYYQDLAAGGGGKLLSTVWNGPNAKYRFEFGDGRQFERAAYSMRRYGWPPDPDSYFNRLNSKQRPGRPNRFGLQREDSVGYAKSEKNCIAIILDEADLVSVSWEFNRMEMVPFRQCFGNEAKA